MNILYVTLKESLPGSHGGAVHVLEVARQLARRGHRVTVLAQQAGSQAPHESLDGFEVVRLPIRSNYLLYRSEPQVREHLESINPDVVMERYYNFSGAGVRAAQQANLPILLEVNAPMLDPRGTRKDFADRALLGSLTRMAREQALAATRIVTPLAATVPFPEARARVRELPWGANIELFDRARLDPAQINALRARINPENRRVVAFVGSFRPWHGISDFITAAETIARAREDVLFLMLGSGELLADARARVERAGMSERIVLTGAIKYEDVTHYLALAEVGVAPFRPDLHPPLSVGFYWSPLKVHEYMAMGLPVVTIDVPGLNEIARDEREGILYRAGDVEELCAAIVRLVDDPALARRLGQAGRARVVENFSWQKHAELLESVLNECLVQ